ncbi:outer membrane beta-barrel protein [Mucilaginibacter sp. CAU 1740]|uniref:outer membrane beta-barrel protein n=1 Tax=Mucilaginibacter sp. CAU 1740 TaxID=3140365 RepID=UPI00325B467F
MDDQLDNDLRNRISEVFDNYEDTTADEGWLLLRERFPMQEKQRRPVYLWWAGAAAALLLFLSIGLWVVSHKNGVNNGSQSLSVKPVKPIQPQNNQVDTATTQPAVTSAPAADLASTKQQTTVQQNAQAPVQHTNPLSGAQAGGQNTIAQNGKQPAKAVVTQPGINVKQFTPVQVPAVNNGLPVASAKVPAQQPVQAADNNNLNTSPSVKKQDSVKSILPKNNQPQFAATQQPPAANSQNNATQAPANKPESPIRVKPKVNSMEALLASEDNKPKKTDEITNEKRVKFSVYAATFFNYAKGSQNQVNAGAGFTSDIRLSKNIKLSTGLAIAQNTLSYDKNQPSNERLLASFSPALTTAYNNVADFSKVAASPSIKSYNAKLVGLDIPVNIKYEFNPQKNDTYFSAGVSSGTFVNEAYTASYSYPGLAQAAGVQQQTTDETTRKSFNSFYFAKTLNLAFGIGYPLGKTNRLIIEPFVKYPLDGLGSQQIKFGAGGLNLKLNFTTHKK